MALINCPECGKQISDKAEKCPQCGLHLPFSPIQRTESNFPYRSKPLSKKNNTGYILGILTFLCLCIVSLILIVRNGSQPANQQKNELIQKNEIGSNDTIQNTSSINNQTTAQNQGTNSGNTTRESIEDKVAAIIVANSYSWYEDGSYATLSFQYEGNPSTGTMVLSSTIHILEFRYEGDRNAIDAVVNPDAICRFEYTYKINDNYINTTFVKSNCNYSGNNHHLTYNERDNTISAYTNEGEMIFKP